MATRELIHCSTTNVWKYSGSAPNGTLAAWRHWRLRIDHPGVWMIHCHLLPHIVWGMNTVRYPLV